MHVVLKNICPLPVRSIRATGVIISSLTRKVFQIFFFLPPLGVRGKKISNSFLDAEDIIINVVAIFLSGKECIYLDIVLLWCRQKHFADQLIAVLQQYKLTLTISHWTLPSRPFNKTKHFQLKRLSRSTFSKFSA